MYCLKAWLQVSLGHRISLGIHFRCMCVDLYWPYVEGYMMHASPNQLLIRQVSTKAETLGFIAEPH
jgi:hypothetical protein